MNIEQKLLRIGTKVKFGEKKEITGEITAVTIREYVTMYEITYWKTDEQKAIWLHETQLKTLKKETLQKIGFVNNEETT